MEQYVRPSRPSEASSELQLDNGEGVPPREDGGESEQMAFSYCGTIDYMAPEVVKREEYGYAVDWWSVGCLLYHMMVGRAPFDDENGKFAVPNSFTPPGGNKKKKKPPQKKGSYVITSPLRERERCARREYGRPEEAKSVHRESEASSLPIFRMSQPFQGLVG